jgi:hypothetical protein
MEMNIVANFEHRASSSRGKHEGESSFALCDRLYRTRDNSQRQLPTDHDYAVPTREYQTDRSSLNLPRLPLALSSRKSKRKLQTTDVAELTRSLHISAMRSLTLNREPCGVLGMFVGKQEVIRGLPGLTVTRERPNTSLMPTCGY